LLTASLQGPGLAPVLDTNDFGLWDATLATTLGHHRSVLLDGREPFAAHFRIGQLGPYGVLHLHTEAACGCCANSAAAACCGCSGGA
jgi:hypothetical protein